MKFDLDHGMGRYAIRGYRQGAIVVNDETLTQSFIITTDRLVRDWPPQRFEEMTAEHLDQITALGPEVAVLGTGARLRFPSRAVTAPLAARLTQYLPSPWQGCMDLGHTQGEGEGWVERLIVLRDSTPILSFPLSQGEGMEKNIQSQISLASS
jgi:uncharacterized protein